MATDCPEPEKCRRCKKEGHKVDECPEPEICFNCREEGHKVGHFLSSRSLAFTDNVVPERLIVLLTC